MSASKEPFKLKRKVGFWGVVGLSVGGMIGSGIFISPKPVLAGTHSIGLCLVVWAFCGLLSLCGAFVGMEVQFMLKRTSATYILYLQTIGAEFAFITTYTSLFLFAPASQAAQGISIASYLTSIFFGDECRAAPYIIRLVLAICVMLFAYAINIYSVNSAIKTQIIFTVIKSVAVAAICLGGIVRLIQGHTENFVNAFENSNTDPTDLALAVIGGNWAYAGSGIGVYEEILNPERNIPLGRFTSIVFVTFLYLLCNISYFTVMAPEQLLRSSAVVTTWAETVIPQFSWIMPIIVGLSIFGAVNGDAFEAGRGAYVPAKQGHLPKLFGMIHVRNYTPSPALMLRVTLIVLYIFVGDSASTLISWTGIAGGIFGFIYRILFIYLRFSPKWRNVPRPIKAPWICVLLTMAVSVFTFLSPFIYRPQWGYFAGIIIALIALALYFPFVRRGFVVPGTNTVTKWLQLYLEVAPESDVNNVITKVVPGDSSVTPTKRVMNGSLQEDPSPFHTTYM